MDIAHLLLGRPWLYDQNIVHHCRENTSTFRFQNKNITLTPYQPKELLPSPRPKSLIISPSPADSPTAPPTTGTISLLQYKPFEKLGNSNRFYLIVLTREASSDHISFLNSLSSDPPSLDQPVETIDLLKLFAGIVLEELPGEFPPLRDIQHAIDLVPNSLTFVVIG